MTNGAVRGRQYPCGARYCRLRYGALADWVSCRLRHRRRGPCVLSAYPVSDVSLRRLTKFARAQQK
eukprot:8184680-Alexandrium_andersonii.AAC.1